MKYLKNGLNFSGCYCVAFQRWHEIGLFDKQTKTSPMDYFKSELQLLFKYGGVDVPAILRYEKSKDREDSPETKT